MRLTPLGSVNHILNDTAVVKIRDPLNIPNLRRRVYDERKRPIGVVVDIIGPVSQPFAVVKLSVKDVSPGEELYVETEKRRRGRA
ncbi:MAG: H/ACA ribonucleoprotein complex subunit GAR1 [Sulfolobales archaeon]